MKILKSIVIILFVLLLVPLVIAQSVPVYLGPELIINGDMELNTYWNPAWSPTVCEQSSELSHSGNYSWKVIGDSGTGVASSYFAPQLEVTEGETYQVSAQVNILNGSAHLYIFTENYETHWTSSTTGQWLNVTTTFDAINLTEPGLAYIYFLSLSGGSTFYVDDVSVRQILNYSGADTNQNGCVELNEMSMYIFLWLNGQVTLQQVSQAVNVWLQGCTPSAFCGNEVVEGGEQCDAGLQNGVECGPPLYGEVCFYCSSSCMTLNVTGEFCGDGICNGPETQATCPQDCPPGGNSYFDNFSGLVNTPLATYDSRYEDARDGYYVQHLLLDGQGGVRMSGNYNGGFSFDDPSVDQNNSQTSQLTLVGNTVGMPHVRMLVQTAWNGGEYYGWEFVSIANNEYTAFTWFQGAPAMAGRSNIDISQHNFDIRSDLVLRTYVEYPEPTVAIVRAYAGTSEGTLIEIGNIEVHNGSGVIAKDGFPADGSVPFWPYGGGRRPGMLFHGNSYGDTSRTLFKEFYYGPSD